MPQPADDPKRINAFRIFKNQDYALYFGGQLGSQAGTWMQQLAISWLTYKLTSSPLLLTVVGASSQIPSLLLMPFAGVIADRFNRKQVLLLTQVMAMLQASALAYLTLTAQIAAWHLVALGILMGIINAFDMPVRSAFVFDLVETKDDLPAAVAMNSSLMNVSRLLGPALAGFVVGAFGEGVCFSLNAASYIAVIGALLFVKASKPRQAAQPASSGRILSELREGLDYTLRTSPIRAIIVLLAVFGFGGMAYAMLLPVFVKEIGGDPNTLGYLSSASALGSTVAAIILATRKSILRLGRWIIISSFVYALSVVALGFSHTFVVAICVLSILGGTMMLQMGSCNTILQSLVEDDKRGRVMSFFSMAFMGTVPLGSLLAGALASRLGFHNTMLICGGYCLMVSVALAVLSQRLREEAKPVYIKQGLLETEEELEIIVKPGA
jgi:MFS family permease